MPLVLPVLSDVDEADIERELRALLAQEEANSVTVGRGVGGGGGGLSSLSSVGNKQQQQQQQQPQQPRGGGGGFTDHLTTTRSRATHKTSSSTTAATLNSKASHNPALSPLRNPPETPLDVHPSPITFNKVGTRKHTGLPQHPGLPTALFPLIAPRIFV